MHLLQPLAFLALALLGENDELAAPAHARLVELAREEPRVMEHVEYLTESIGPRLSGTSSLQRACDWAAARFASFGLAVRLEEWGEVPVGFHRGFQRGRMVVPYVQPLVFSTNAWTAGTPGPVRARAALYPRSLEDLEARREELAGAWLVDRPRGERPTREERLELESAMEEVAAAGRIQSARSGLLVHTGGRFRDLDPEELPSEVRVRLQAPQFDDLVARLQREEPVELELDIDNRFLPGPVPQYNVVADLPGTELPDEYVIVGGHIDSWDGGTGAQDNATGVATTIEAARLLTAVGARPRRTIRFVLWGGEEQGLLGSKGYVRDHADELDRISAVLVHDGGTNWLSGLAGPPALVPGLREAFAPVFELDPTKPFVIEENEGLSPRGSSDHSPYVQAGVPGFFWRQEGRASYRFVHHTQNDVLEHVVPEYQEHSALVVALGALGLANLDEPLSREGLIREPRPDTRRRMGVQLEDTAVTRVVEGGMADGAGWQEGDVIVAIDGVGVSGTREVVSELQKGGPRKVVSLRRGEETIESVLDYTGTPVELAREQLRAEKEAEAASAETGS